MLRKLQQERAGIVTAMRAQIDAAEKEGTGFSAEQQAEWDARDAALVDIEARIARIQEQDERERALALTSSVPAEGGAGAGAPGDPHGEAFRSWCRHGMGALSPEQRSLLVDPPPEMRALAVGTPAAGGYLVPEGFYKKLTETLKVFGSVRKVANVITTATGNDMPWPTVDDTANEGAILAENTAAAELDVAFGQNILKAFMWTSKMIRVPIQLLDDSAFDIEAFLTRKLGQRIARAQEDKYATGVGTTEPKGITSFAVGKQGITGQTTSVIYDDLVDLIHSVDSAYREAGACRFMLHDLSLAKIRKIKDTAGVPIWQPTISMGEPSSILGYPTAINNKMPVMAVSAKSIAFGDFFEGYIIRDVAGAGLMRLDQRYAEYLQVAYLAYLRGDATIDNAGAVRLYQNSAV